MSAARVGTVGWAIPRGCAGDFPGEGTHLERYARVLSAVEIDSTFYRSHRHETYTRWAASVPKAFRFSAKLPKEATHKRRLVGTEDVVRRFLDEIRNLGDKLGPLLVQLPPGDTPAADTFFAVLRQQHTGELACEPRHASWFAPEAEGLLRAHRIARVAADPPPILHASFPGGDPGLAYFRLHGSPEVYRSAYDAAFLEPLAATLRGFAGETWCIFDNTAAGAAAVNALDLLRRLRA